jgi:hypothetical protein
MVVFFPIVLSVTQVGNARHGTSLPRSCKPRLDAGQRRLPLKTMQEHAAYRAHEVLKTGICCDAPIA